MVLETNILACPSPQEEVISRSGLGILPWWTSSPIDEYNKGHYLNILIIYARKRQFLYILPAYFKED
jgi:hypothetical protein